MQIILRSILVNLFLVLLTAIAHAGEKDSISLRNVFEIAKQLRMFKNNQTAYSPQDKLRLLAAIQYFNQNDDNAALAISEKYPLLVEVNSVLTKNIVSYQSFFSETRIDIEEAFKKNKGVADSLKTALLSLKIAYEEARGKLNSTQDSLRQLDSLLFDVSIKLEKSRTEIKLLDMAVLSVRSVPDSVNLLALKKDSLQKEYHTWDSLLVKNTAIREKARVYKNQLDAGLDVIRSKAISLLQDHSVTLFGFLRTLSRQSVEFTPELKSIFENVSGQFNKSADIHIQAIIQQMESASRSSFRMPSQSEIIDALAIYLAGRIKQEAVMWFFETITKSIRSYPLIRDFFPNTCVLLESREAYEIPNLGTQWRYALSKDFLIMPRNVISSQWFLDKWPGDKLDISFITGACDMAEMLTRHYSFRETIQALYLKQPQIQKEKLVFQDFVNLLYMVNNELILSDGRDGYRLLRYEDYRNMNREEMELMLSLLDIRYKGVFSKFLNGMDVRFSLESSSGPVSAEKIRQWLGNIQMVIAQIERVRTEYVSKNNKAGEEESRTFYDYHTIWESFSPLWQLFMTADSNGSLFNKKVQACKDIFPFVNRFQEVYGQIDNKNFAGAVQNLLSLVDTLFYGSWKVKDKLLLSEITRDEKLKKLAEKSILVKTLLEKENVRKSDSTIPESVNKTVLASVIFEEERHAMALVRTIAGFLNDVALAKSDKQLAKVVESYALPAGSYKRKRNNWWSIDLNAFAGPYVGFEWIKPDKELSQTPKASRPVFGFSVPIGLSFSKTFGRKLDAYDALGRDEILNPDKVKLLKNGVYRRTRWTVTTTVSLIDIGAVVSYRLKSSADTALPQDVKWAQVFSPGIHIGIAIPNTPLVVSTGLVFAPQLRKFKDDNSIINSGKQYSDNYNAVRMYAGLFFDIPLFNLWERKRIVYR